MPGIYRPLLLILEADTQSEKWEVVSGIKSKGNERAGATHSREGFSG